MDIFIKLLKFIGFLLLLGVLAFSFMIFGWGGLILTLLVIGGAVAIFGDN